MSAICKILDEELPREKGFSDIGSVWTKHGVAEAVKIILNTNTPLLDSMAKQLDAYKDLRDMIEGILYQGRQVVFSSAERSVNLGMMFGFLKNAGGYVSIANRIFEMYLLNLLEF